MCFLLQNGFGRYLTRERRCPADHTGNAEDLRNAMQFMQGDGSTEILDKLSNKKAISVQANK